MFVSPQRKSAQNDGSESVVVIGGGNVAMDVARSLARKQKAQYGKVQLIVSAMEDFDHFLADEEEVKESIEEGILILDSRGPKACVVDDSGQLSGLNTLGVTSIFDDQGRFAPKYDEADEQTHPAEMIIEAIGQMSDVPLLSIVHSLAPQGRWPG